MGVAVGWPWSYRALIRPAWLLSQRVPQERFCQEACGAGDSSNDSCAVLAVVRYSQAPRPLRAALHHSRLGPPCLQSSMSSQYPRRQTCPSRAEVRKLHHAAFRAALAHPNPYCIMPCGRSVSAAGLASVVLSNERPFL